MASKSNKLSHDLLFRVGLGGLFLANSITAWATPDEFRGLIENHTWLTNIVNSGTFVHLIGLNDFMLFVAFVLVLGKWRKLVAVWSTLWIIGVIYVTGVWTTDFIEHAAILLLIGYYYLANQRALAK